MLSSVHWIISLASCHQLQNVQNTSMERSQTQLGGIRNNQLKSSRGAQDSHPGPESFIKPVCTWHVYCVEKHVLGQLWATSCGPDAASLILEETLIRILKIDESKQY